MQGEVRSRERCPRRLALGLRALAQPWLRRRALSLLVAAALIELRGEAAYGFARAALDAVSRERTFFGDEAEALNALDRALRQCGA